MTEETEKPSESEDGVTAPGARKISSSSESTASNNNNNCMKGEHGIVVSTLMYNGFKSSTQEKHDEGDETITTFTFGSDSPICNGQVDDASDEDEDPVNNDHDDSGETEQTVLEEKEGRPVSPSQVCVQVIDSGLGGTESSSSGSSSIATSNECIQQSGTDCSSTTTVTNSVNANNNDTSRRHSKSSSLPHGVKLCSEATSSGGVNGGGAEGNDGAGSIDETDNQTEEKWRKLEEELTKALAELKAKDDEVEKLKDIKQQVEGELEDLTASLFVEAHKMVSEAKKKEISSAKSLREAQMQMEGLQAEVVALKALLITSTPSRPNLGGMGTSGSGAGGSNSNGISIFKKQHKRYPSHNQLQYGRAENEIDKEKDRRVSDINKPIETDPSLVDPALFRLFVDWRKEPTLTAKEKNPFLKKIYSEDVEPCLSFENDLLVVRLKKAIEENSIWVEPLAEKDKTSIPKECAFLCTPRICHYRLSFDYQSDEWFEISQFCRDRIAAVGEFLNYLRYIKNGLVKSQNDVAYWEVIRLRKQMALAKLGIPFQ